jgi:hypothetical protein
VGLPSSRLGDSKPAHHFRVSVFYFFRSRRLPPLKIAPVAKPKKSITSGNHDCTMTAKQATHFLKKMCGTGASKAWALTLGGLI